jgi:hypothetical protein
MRDSPRLNLPQRHGIRPSIARSLPHLQLEQEGSLFCIQRLLSRVSRLPGLCLRLSRNTPRGSMSLVQDSQWIIRLAVMMYIRVPLSSPVWPSSGCFVSTGAPGSCHIRDWFASV